MNTITIILFALIVGIISYVLGLRRGVKIAEEEVDQAREDYKDAYWEGYADGRYDPRPECLDDSYNDGYESGYTMATRNLKADVLVEGLKDLFEGDEYNEAAIKDSDETDNRV